MVITHNIMATNAAMNLNNNNKKLNKNLEKLSSGYKINRAADDAAGLAISEAMRSKINGLEQAEANSKDGIGLIQTADGALTEIHSMLQRLTVLATQAANGTYSANGDDKSTARSSIQLEVDELKNEVTSIAKNTSYNGISLLIMDGIKDKVKTNDVLPDINILMNSVGDINTDNNPVKNQDTVLPSLRKAFRPLGYDCRENERKPEIDGHALKSALDLAESYIVNFDDGLDKTDYVTSISKLISAITAPQTIRLQIGATANETLDINGANMTSIGIGINNIDVTTVSNANNAITTVNSAIDHVAAYRADLGAKQNRLEHIINNLEVSDENVTNAESRIRDTDMATEIASYSKNNIISQASMAMLAQSNQSAQSVLQLLQ